MSYRMEQAIPPKSEWNDYFRRNEEIPTTVVNALCLEWFLPDGRFMRIFSPFFRISQLNQVDTKNLAQENHDDLAFSHSLRNLRAHLDKYIGRSIQIPNEADRSEFDWEIAFQCEDRLLKASRLIREKFLTRQNFENIENYLMRWDGSVEHVESDIEANESDKHTIEYDWSLAAKLIDPLQQLSRKLTLTSAAISKQASESGTADRLHDALLGSASLLDFAFPSLRNPIPSAKSVALLKRASLSATKASRLAKVATNQGLVLPRTFDSEIAHFALKVVSSMRRFRDSSRVAANAGLSP